MDTRAKAKKRVVRLLAWTCLAESGVSRYSTPELALLDQCIIVEAAVIEGTFESS